MGEIDTEGVLYSLRDAMGDLRPFKTSKFDPEMLAFLPEKAGELVRDSPFIIEPVLVE